METVKVKGTKKELEECGDWFLNHPHLQSYVRHLEVWVPVWEMKSAERSLCLAMKAVAHDRRPPIAHRAAQSTWPNTGVNRFEEPSNISLAYQQATANATLDELLMYAKALFPEAYALTIEGGHCKKPPRIRFFRDTKLKACQSKNTPQQLPVLPNIRTLVLRGAWNIIRQDTDFHIISHAFPNLSEWQCAYSKPKTDGYIAMCAVLQYFPQTIVRLDLCLEGLYAKEITSLHKWHKLEDNHICLDLGRLGPQLESLSFTGRVCAGFFKSAIQCANLNLRNTPRLKSLDLIVKNCCMEDTWTWNSSTGINNWDFIRRFRALVTEGVRALKTYPRVSYMRIRFIDLDSINPLLNPYFHLQDTGMHKGKPRSRCTGVWNDEILELLQAARPGLGFEGMGEDGEFEMEGKWRVRPRNINFASYATLAEGPLS